jgi:hypothetical protein
VTDEREPRRHDDASQKTARPANSQYFLDLLADPPMLDGMKCPPISKIFIFADDAKLAAQLSCMLARPGLYLPVCDGPRLQRPDRDTEIIRRHNAAARASPLVRRCMRRCQR